MLEMLRGTFGFVVVNILRINRFVMVRTKNYKITKTHFSLLATMTLQCPAFFSQFLYDIAASQSLTLPSVLSGTLTTSDVIQDARRTVVNDTRL